MFLGLLDPDPDPLVRGMDPDPDPDPALDQDPDPSIIKGAQAGDIRDRFIYTERSDLGRLLED